MKNLKDAKQIYDHIVVPEELEERLKSVLENTEPKKSAICTPLSFARWAATAAASLLLCFTIALNSSQSFAMEMSDLPVIGQIARVLTIRSYETTDGNTTTTVEIPEVQVETSDTDVSKSITDVNQKIQSLVDEYTAKKELEIAEFKAAFLESDGTAEEWDARSIEVNVNYEIKHQSDTILSLLIDSWISWFNFEEERTFYNINLLTGEELTLVDFLGADAYDYATNYVLKEMKARYEKDPENITFWGVTETEDIGEEFTGVTEDTKFYINATGNVVISYDKYEVAPGFMGIVEFEIPLN